MTVMDSDPLASLHAEIQELRSFLEDGLKHIRNQVNTNALAHYAQVEALLSLHKRGPLQTSATAHARLVDFTGFRSDPGIADS